MFGLAVVVLKNFVVLPGVAAVCVGDMSGLRPRHLTMSFRTLGVAVAVSAMIGTDGSMSVLFSQLSSLYAGLKSWPHSLTQ